jgi:hypothetical protein
MLNKIKNKRGKIIFLIGIFQILLLIIMTHAESYTIYQTNYSFEKLIINSGKENKIKDLLGAGINLLIGFLSIKEIGFVSAQGLDSCCLDTCDDTTSDDTTCQNLAPTKCDSITECQKGCCFDSTEGTCSTNSPRGRCESNGGDWSNDAACSISKCRRGCCVLGSNVRFTTETNCEKISSGGTVDFRQIWNERDCLALSTSQLEGACVLTNKNCKFETGTQCSTDKGKFYQGYLCSYEALDTKCKKQSSVECVEGKDELYWLDSCGNRENIYSSDKTASWNGGLVLTKEASCNPTSGNIGSTSCGNCNIGLSSRCSATKVGETHVADGNFVCEDLMCKNAPDNVGTQDRANGEKWCLYDGYIGDGRDTVGSEHWLASCVNGKVRIERCGEYRSSLCQQNTITEGTFSYTEASCVPNNDVGCQQITQDYFDGTTDLSTMTDACNADVHCMIKNVDVGQYFQFSTCVPRYPKGDILTDDLDANLCTIADRTCTVIYKKGLLGPWTPEENSCESSAFAQQMNDFCISIGDCGDKINYIGVGKDNSKITGKKGYQLDSDGKETSTASEGTGSPPAVYSWTNYKSDANAVDGQVVTPKDMSKELASILGNNYSPAAVDNWLAGISGAIGIPVAMLGAYGASYVVGLFTGAQFAVGASFFNVLGAAAIGAGLGYLIARWLNLSPSAVYGWIIAGALAGAGIGIMLISSGTGLCSTLYGCVAGIILIIIAIIIAILTFETRESRKIEYKCLPWVAPNGGKDCGKCDDDPLRPCTEYRCSALGLLCKLENANTEHPVCISLAPTNVAPVISKGKVRTEGYSFGDEVAISSGTKVDITGCIQEFGKVWFNLSTSRDNKPLATQCKYSFSQPPTGYDDMQGEFPEEENLYTMEHNFIISMPSLDNENVFGVTGEAPNKKGELNMYVKCADGQDPAVYNIRDYIVHFCIGASPDETAVNFARIITEPNNGAVLKYGTTESDLKIWTNEKVEACKYDTAADKSYDNMQYTFIVGQEDFRGWLSSTTLTGLTAGENKFYIKCKDISGNVNTEDFVYTLKVSQSELKVDSINFYYGIKKINSGDTFSVGTEPISVDMEVKTSGGGYDGTAGCFWGVSDGGSRFLFKDTFSTLHKQVFSERFQGTFTNYIYCKDDAGNEANSVGEFTVEVDNTPPKVVRAFKDGGNLKIETSDLAKCYYSLKDCNFNLKDGTPMTGSASSKIHSTPWKQGNDYHVKCEDAFGNVNPECAIEIVPSF